MANNKITYDIGFNFDKNSINQLKKELKSIQEMTTKDFMLFGNTDAKNLRSAGKELIEIKQTADQVNKALDDAFNVNVGTTNITKFSNSIKNIGLDKIQKQFSAVGVEGNAAFRSLTTSLTTTNTQLKQSNKLLDNMAISLKNTIKWGISSAIFNNMVGSLKSAWGYVQKLDKSLNDIRIVSGQSADQMERFSKQANIAAQRLGSTTLDYTKAALIYYQQGLTDEQVNKMTDITIKMSNVLGSSAQEVSDYMTAIWNNFAEGGENLEYYADVITALGAATASSAEEISQGLEKFAAVGKTVGLSYEYATSALATITAQTRQSADTVGTALKTLFARIQDLELGNTLDDGTTLGKYSEALYKVGINIKDNSGELKKMDDILDEMGSKWRTLSSDQQTALAQAVAGTRQYTQLVALMDNWDFMKTNLETAANATGELNKQQQTYLESTEAHMEKLTTASQRLMSALFNKKDINGAIDGLTSVVQLFSNLIESVGGGRNAFLMLGSVGMQVFGNQIAQSLNTTLVNLQKTKQQAEDLKTVLNNLKIDFSTNNTLPKGFFTGNQSKDFTESQNRFAEALPALNNEDRQIGENYLQKIQDAINKQLQMEENLKQAIDLYLQFNSADMDKTQQEEFINSPFDSQYEVSDLDNNVQNWIEEVNEQIISIEEKMSTVLSDKNIDLNSFKEVLNSVSEATDVIEVFRGKYGDLFESNDVQEMDAVIEKIRNFKKEVTDEQGQVVEILPLDDDDKNYYEDFFIKLYGYVKNFKKQTLDSSNTLAQKSEFIFKTLGDKGGDTYRKLTGENQKFIEDNINGFKTFSKNAERIADIKSFTNLVAGIGQVASSWTALTHLPKIWDSEDLSTFEKISQTLTSILTGIPTLINGLSLIKNNVKGAGDLLKDLIISVAEKIIKNKAEQVSNMALAASEKEVQVAQEMTNKTKTVGGTEATATKIANNEAEIISNEALVASENAAAAGGEVMGASGAAAGAGMAAGAEGTVGFGTALLTILPYVAIAIAVIGALIAIVTILVKAYNADRDAAAKANEAVNRLSDAYENCKKEAEDLKNTISDYSDAKDELKDLTVGTEEYEEALKNANAKAKELIETYGLFNDYEIKDGLITFNEGVLENLQNKKDKNENDAENQLYEGKIYANQANLKYDNTKLRRKIGYQVYDDYSGSYRQFSNEELTSTANAINSIINELGVDITKNDEKLKEELLARSDVPDAVKENINAILKNKDHLIDYANSLKEAEEANKYYSAQIMENVIGEKYSDKIGSMATTKNEEGKDVTDEKRAEQIKAIAAKWATNDINAMQKELEAIDVSNASSNNKLNKNYGYQIENDEDLAKEYAQRISHSDLSKSEMTYEGGNNKGTIKDKSGNTIFENLSDDDMREALAKLKATEDIQEKYSDKINQENLLDNLNIAMEGMKELGAEYGTDFTDAFLNAVYSDTHQLDLSSLYAFLNPDEIEELGSFTGQEWLDKIGLSEDQLKEFGFDSAQDFAKTFKEGLLNYEWNAGEAVSAAITADDQSKLEKHDLNLEEVKNYSTYLMETAESSDELADSLKHDAEAATIVSQAISRMNNGIEKLSDGFEDWSDILKKSEKSSEEYYEALTKMKDAVADLLDTEDEYVTDDFIQKHLNEIKKAADGDSKAIDNLHKELAKDMVLNIATNNNGKIIDEQQIDIDIESLKDKINNLDVPNVEVGSSMDFTKMDSDMQEFTKKMIEIVQSAHMTAEEANEFFGQMGFSAKFETKPEKVTRTVPVETSESEITSLFPLKMTTRTYQSGTESVTQTVDVPAMTTNGEDPKITLTAKPGGSFNNKSSKNKGGSSGKSSGSSKTSKIEGEKDLYEKVNVQLGKTGKTLEKIESQTEHLTGLDLVNNLNNQLKYLNKEIDYTNDKLKIMYNEQSDLQKKLSSTYGAKFNSEGVLTNYSSIYDKELAAANKVLTSSKSTDKQKEAAQKRWDNFLKWYQRYDELVSSEIPEQENKILEDLYKKIEIKIQKLKLELELKIDLKEFQETFNEFFKNVLNPNQFKYGSALGEMEKSLKNLQDMFNIGILDSNIKEIETAMENFNSIFAGKDNKSGTEATDDAAYLETLKESVETLMENLGSIEETINSVGENYRNVLNEVSSEMEQQLSIYNQISTLINHNIKAAQLLGGETRVYEELKKLYAVQTKNSKEQLNIQKNQLDIWKKSKDEAIQRRDALKTEYEAAEKAGKASTELKYLYDESIKNADSAIEQWENAVNNYAESWAEWVENIQAETANAVQAIYQAQEDILTNGFGLDYANQEWELINKNADTYLDTINSAWAIQQLENKYNDSIDNTDNILTQRKLNDLKEQQLKMLREQDKLSQYDIDRANQLYELELKKIALEESQQNKNTMRLRRDSQGNYTYQYVNDENEIDKLKNEIGDLYNSLYNFDKDAYKTTIQNIIDTWEEQKEAMAEAMTIEDPKEQAQRRELIEKQYGTRLNDLISEYTKQRTNLQASGFSDMLYLYDLNIDNYETMTEEQKALLDQFAAEQTITSDSAFDNLFNQYSVNTSQFDSMMQSITGIWDNSWTAMVNQLANSEGGNSLSNVLSTINEELLTISEEYAKTWTEAQQTYAEFTESVNSDTEKIKTNVEENLDVINDEWETAITKVNDYMDVLGELLLKYQNVIDKAKEVATATANAVVDEIKEDVDEIKDQDVGSEGGGNSNEEKDDDSVDTSGGGETYPYGKASGLSGTYKKGSSGSGVKAIQYALNKLGYGNSGTKSIDGKFGANTAKAVKAFQKAMGISADGVVGKNTKKKFGIKGFDTGGYTGSWGSEGKIGILHEKELVLNAKDTENILAAVSALRYMNGMMLNGLTSSNMINGGNGLEQNVHIEANFPNVTSANEIENALNNLVNAASQYIYEDKNR